MLVYTCVRNNLIIKQNKWLSNIIIKLNVIYFTKSKRTIRTQSYSSFIYGTRVLFCCKVSLEAIVYNNCTSSVPLLFLLLYTENKTHVFFVAKLNYLNIYLLVHREFYNWRKYNCRLAEYPLRLLSMPVNYFNPPTPSSHTYSDAPPETIVTVIHTDVTYLYIGKWTSDNITILIVLVYML